MKNISMTGFLTLAVVSAGFLNGTNAFAISSAQADSLKGTLTHTAVPEMPAKAADLVGAAKAEDRADVAQVVVRVSVDRKPALAPSIVAAIATRSPEVAGASAVSAALLQPKQIGAITKAAVLAAPAQVGQIVAAMCERFPARYNLIAMAAFEAAPQSGKTILSAVAANVSVLKSTIERATAGSSVDVAAVIHETEQYVQATANSFKTTVEKVLTANGPISADTLAMAPPSVGGPFQTVPGSPTTLDRNNTSVVAPGGSRDYSGM